MPGRQFGRNAPRTNQPGRVAGTTDGTTVNIAGDAVNKLGTIAGEAAPDSGFGMIAAAHSVRALRDEIGTEGIRQAAIDAGRTPPSDRTIRRWVAADRIPHDGVAERAERRALVTSQGGVKDFAAKIGLSPSAIRRYQNGTTSNFRSKDHQQTAAKAQTDTVLSRAGAADSSGNLVKSPKITVTAPYEYGTPGKPKSPDYRADRKFTITDLSDANAADFAAAIAGGDHASALAVVERYLTEDYASSFGQYDEDTGFHMLDVTSFDIEWE